MFKQVGKASLRQPEGSQLTPVGYLALHFTKYEISRHLIGLSPAESRWSSPVTLRSSRWLRTCLTMRLWVEVNFDAQHQRLVRTLSRSD